ncbi:MAG: aldo/keto reductase [Lachnospiraceae bacterium]|nr:aldo/keto reductase [Lachnospiraceae bacterium]
MQYRKDKYGNEISVLGYGCMRFSQTAGIVDVNKAEKEILSAIEGGINYFDTAYIYPGSEAALGEILSRNSLRDKVKIATKLPHYMLKKPEDMDKYFSEQLSRLKTDHVDYYLMHMLTDIKTWNRLKDMGILSWLEEKKKSGAIGQIGFSYHGNSDMFCELIDDYDWDFCQIQYNYLDENSQAGKTGLHHAASKGIPVVIMEPLRGGKLVNNLPKEAISLFENYSVKRSPAEWALRWLWNQPEVTCVLSGMNSMEMVDENMRIASNAPVGNLSDDDLELLAKIVKAINQSMRVGCTGCRYCMPCPKNVDIPGTFAAYNRQASDGKLTALREYFMCTGLRKDYTGPGNCIECGKCEQHCPQHIEIRKELKNAKRSLEGPVYRLVRKVAPFILKY